MSAVQTTPFGRALRHWRGLRGVSQLDLAGAAATTPRHLSFLETGRSRPSRGMVDRLADALTVPLRERNRLLALAGLPASYPEGDLAAGDLAAFRRVIDRLLSTHEPYPAFVVAAGRGPPAGKVVCPRFRLDGRIVATVTVAARFESTTDITLDELRVELIYREDTDADRFFHEQAGLA